MVRVTQSSSRAVLIASVLGVVVGALVLIIAVLEEPYHIDELRQVRSYSSSFGEIVDASFAQEQPPLDPLLNATLQRVIGVGDTHQRLLPALWGIGSLIVLGLLLNRSGLAIGAPVAIALMAIAPGLVAVTAYARPYALPLFLTLLFLEGSDRWLREGSRLGGAIAIVAALLLPLSRTVEPPVVLAATAAWLVVLRIQNSEVTQARWKLPVAAAIAALLLVEIPVYLRLSSDLAEYTVDASVAWGGLSRLGSELPEVLSQEIGIFGLAVALTAAAWPPVRTRVAGLWWFWPLVAVPIGFALLFFLRTPESQPYFDRYVFSWWPPLAALAGAITHVAVEGRSRRLLAGAGLAVVTGLALWSLGGLLTQLSTKELPDWRAVSAVIGTETADGAVVLYDSVRPFGLYRTPFAGWPRYTGQDLRPPLSLHIAADPDLVPHDAPVYVALLGAQPDVSGWTKQQVDSFFTFYTPVEERRGRVGAADSFTEFGHAVDPLDGAAMLLAAASLYSSVSLPEAALEATCGATRIQSSRSEAIRSFAREVGLPVTDCEVP